MLVALGACGGGSPATSSTDESLDVVASFYPLQFATEQVAGTYASVTNLTPAGGEPHELELTPRDTARLQDADLVVYEAGLAPALDDGLADLPSERVFDVSAAARLDLQSTAGTTTNDPHFWLDPTRLADVGDSVAEQLAAIDPDHTAEYTDAAADLHRRLDELDAEFAAGLTGCASTAIVSSHEAFGYLANRYGFTEVGIAGLTPDAEPSPAKLAEVSRFVAANGVTTIYYESLVDPAIARTVADETGAATAVLDPIEGLTDESAGHDYFEVMRSDLATLRVGQGCP